MQIVEKTKRRSGWRVYRTLAALGVPRSVFYAWKKRETTSSTSNGDCASSVFTICGSGDAALQLPLT